MDLIEDMGADERGGPLVTRGTQTDWTGESNGKLTGTVGSQTDDVGGRLIVTLDTETKQGIFIFSEQLLPGLSDEITLDHICTKLPWTAFHILLAVSRLWEQAIRSRRVYNARVRANSTEMLVVLQHQLSHSYGIALYSMRENHCYRVPEISQLETGFPETFKCIALDGKIYVLGEDFGQCGSEVYELDLVGQKQWKQCEGMVTPRKDSALEVMDGKIYVCGGINDAVDPSCGCEMYDPEEDFWSSISSTTKIRFDHHITAFGGELFAYGGCVYAEEFGLDLKPHYHVVDAEFLEVYNPAQDKWRVVEPFGQEGLQRLFVAQGKFYLMTPTSIYALDDGDVEKNAWTELHSFSLPYTGLQDYDVYPTLVIDDELLIMCECVNPEDYIQNIDKTCLFRTKGFGGKTEELVWEEANCPLSFENRSSMCLIQL